jgi:hypothetical protein
VLSISHEEDKDEILNDDSHLECLKHRSNLFKGDKKDTAYVMGIIDFFTEYNLAKQLEYN